MSRFSRPSSLALVGLLAALAVAVFLARTGALPSPKQAAIGAGTLRVTVLDVGQGDSIVVMAPGGKAILVDAGNSSADASRVIIPFLEAHGIRQLEAAVLTHPDQDHVGGMATVLERIPTRAFIDSVQPNTNRAYARTLELLRDKEIRALRARRPEPLIELDPLVKVELLWPRDPLLSGERAENNNSVVLRLRYNGVSVLLTGDLEAEGEAQLVREHPDLAAQILKVAHHGSRTSSTDRFLGAVRPEVALISAGQNNPFGHPHRDALRRLRAHGTGIHRTDQGGSLTVSTDGAGYQVRTER